MPPHDTQPLLHAGAPIDGADAVTLLVHGRGGSAKDFLALSQWIDLPGIAFLAPQASGMTWYPHSFLAPIEQNQPGVDSGIARLESIVADLLARGVESGRVVIVGFSQGACLASTFAACHPRRYAGLACIIGGLIGAPGTHFEFEGSLERTPVYLAAHDPDPHVPAERVAETERVLTGMGAAVTFERFINSPHMLMDEHIERVRSLIREAT